MDAEARLAYPAGGRVDAALGPGVRARERAGRRCGALGRCALGVAWLALRVALGPAPTDEMRACAPLSALLDDALVLDENRGD